MKEYDVYMREQGEYMTEHGEYMREQGEYMLKHGGIIAPSFSGLWIWIPLKSGWTPDL